MRYLFEDCALDLDRRELRRGIDPIPLEPQVLDLLVFLIANRDRVVSRDDLIASVWQGRIVSESALNTRIHAARCAIGDTGEDQRLIKTFPRKGIRFVATVSEEQRLDPGPLRQPLSLPDKPSIAVLAFANISGDPGQEYFSDGITQDIITELSRFPELFVIARNSSFRYKGRSFDVRQVGSELGARYVLEGSIRRSGDQVRISAQLVDAQTGAHRWAERYDRELSDIFAMQAEVARTIACILVAHVNRAEAQHTLLKPPSTWQAHDYYLRAAANFASLFLPSLEKLHETRHLLERSLAVDPKYARALAALSNTYVIPWLQQMDDDFLKQATLDRAYELARKAVQADPSHAHAHAQLGWVLSFRGEHEAAIEAFERAAALNPNFTGYHFGGALICAGEFDRAEQSLKAHMRVDPFYLPMAAAYVGLLHYMRKRFVDAVGPLREAVSRMPNFRAPHGILTAVYGQLGWEAEARGQAAEVLRIEPAFTIEGTLKRIFKFKHPEHAELYYEGYRKAGLPEK